MNTATLSRQEIARQRVSVIRNALEVANEELVKAFEARDWEALGYPDFAAYCATELPELRFIKLRVEVRRERATALRDQGATIPEIVAATGSSLGTIHRDLTPPKPSFQMETAPALLAEDVAALTNWQSVVRHVGRAGQRGQTCLEFEAESAWGHGKSSAAFHAAERKGYISRDGRFRQGYAVYVRSSAQ